MGETASTSRFRGIQLVDNQRKIEREKKQQEKLTI